MEEEKFPIPGVGVMILRDNKVLLGFRKNTHGAGSWAFPGGKIQFGETIIAAAKRETKEECGLEIDDISLVSIYDELDFFQTDKKHFLGLGVLARKVVGEPQVLEPEKISEWRWFSLDALPSEIFKNTAMTLKHFQNKVIYNPED